MKAPEVAVITARRSTAAPAAMTSSRTPIRARTSTQLDWKALVEGTSLGKCALSSSATDMPRRAGITADGDPAQRAPTIITS
ncbi:hypothetical protein NN3_19410 [Nocardia neocaledoniensis NBRC 108232]|nr:hypothetical protein [Nocardia neocaledoniensis]GEM30934.1 hypothetical protein NN3_19410 [Nocardia neocaledoniensis NBRC 108232]